MKYKADTECSDVNCCELLPELRYFNLYVKFAGAFPGF